LFSNNLAIAKKEEEEDKGGVVAAGVEEGDIKKTDSCWLL
jgi:hypothetical protein